MAINLAAAFDKVVALMESITGMQKVFQGVPDAFGPSITGFVAITSQETMDAATQLLRVRCTFYIVMGYKTKTDQAAAERILIDGITDLIRKFYVARKSDFDGTVENASIDMTLAGQPEYEVMAGSEYRRYPILIHIEQSENI